jgi:hypothetical protein
MSSISAQSPKISLCPSTARLIPAAAGAPVQVPISRGSIDLGAADVALASATIAIQPYSRIELVADQSCGSAPSVGVSNASGTFSTTSSVTMSFAGPFSVDAGTQTIRLSAQPLANQLGTVNSNAQVKPAAESAPGQALPGPIEFRQMQQVWAPSGTSSLTTPAFGNTVAAGNMIVCWSYYQSTSVSVTGVTDTGGNSYWQFIGPIAGKDGKLVNYSEVIWYTGTGVSTGGSNFKVTMQWSGSIPGEAALNCYEYAGISTNLPGDASGPGWGSGANAALSMVTNAPNELIFAATLFDPSGAGGAGYTERSNLRGAVVEDAIAGAPGIYSAPYVNAAVPWFGLFMSFKGN